MFKQAVRFRMDIGINIYLSHFRIFFFLLIDFQKMRITFCELNANFPKYSVNFTNLSSYLNIVYCFEY